MLHLVKNKRYWVRGDGKNEKEKDLQGDPETVVAELLEKTKRKWLISSYITL